MAFDYVCNIFCSITLELGEKGICAQEPKLSILDWVICLQMRKF